MKFLTLLLVASLWLAGCSLTPSERAVAEKCPDVTALFKNTHNWMMIGVVNSNHESHALIQLHGSDLSWREGEQVDTLTPEQAAARVVASLEGKPGQLMMHYLGQPRRGYYLVDLDGAGKVVRVGDYHWAD